MILIKIIWPRLFPLENKVLFLYLVFDDFDSMQIISYCKY